MIGVTRNHIEIEDVVIITLTFPIQKILHQCENFAENYFKNLLA